MRIPGTLLRQASPLADPACQVVCLESPDDEELPRFDATLRRHGLAPLAARGIDVLLFLHADTHLPEGFPQTVRATLADGCVAGAFRLRIDGEHPGLRWVEWGANLRSRLLALPYGDQALFLPARRFYDMGGFADVPWMEDIEFVRRLRRTGRIAIAPTAVTTSARRWQSWGILRTTLIHQACLAGYLLGIPPRWLHRWRGGGGRPDR